MITPPFYSSLWNSWFYPSTVSFPGRLKTPYSEVGSTRRQKTIVLYPPLLYLLLDTGSLIHPEHPIPVISCQINSLECLFSVLQIKQLVSTGKVGATLNQCISAFSAPNSVIQPSLDLSWHTLSNDYSSNKSNHPHIVLQRFKNSHCVAAPKPQKDTWIDRQTL